jgi:hypothetical protein
MPAEATGKITINIRTPRFAWMVANQCQMKVAGVPMPRIVRFGYLFWKIRHMKRTE